MLVLSGLALTCSRVRGRAKKSPSLYNHCMRKQAGHVLFSGPISEMPKKPKWPKGNCRIAGCNYICLEP